MKISSKQLVTDAMGRISGAFHAPRGMLEFRIDPDNPCQRDVFGQDARFVVFRAGGMRFAPDTDIDQTMGLSPVCHIEGGFGAWKVAGGPVE